jgi:hypothetical protein
MMNEPQFAFYLQVRSFFPVSIQEEIKENDQ